MSLKSLQINRHGNRKLIMEKMSNTLLINIFAWSILGGFTACVSDCDTFWCIVILWKCDALFWAMIFMDFWGLFWALKILFFSLWNSPGRNLLSEGLGRGHKESQWNILLELPGSLGLWPGSGTRVWSFYGFEILQRALLYFCRMREGFILYFDACMSG